MELVVKNVTENDDGSCDVDLDYDDEALDAGRIWASGQENIDVTDEAAVMQGFVISMLEDAIKEDMEEKAIDADK